MAAARTDWSKIQEMVSEQQGRLLSRRPADRFTGALLALACGDALGAPAEFLTKDQLASLHGRLEEMVGGGGHHWEPGEWTDDTGMTLCVAEGILETPGEPVEALGRRFIRWRRTAKDVGSTISAALNGFDGNWGEASRNTPQARMGKAAGNGSLMRTLPVALAYPDRAQMLRQSARISAMTHWDPQAELACAVYCLWIRNLLEGQDIAGAWASALEEGRSVESEGQRASDTPGPTPVPHIFWERLETAHERSENEIQPSGYAGYVLDCLEAVVWCCHQESTIDEALIRAVNLAGEADTIAAIAGGVLGTAYGPEGLRVSWLEKLFDKARLEEVGRRIAQLRHELVYSSPGIPRFSTYKVSAGLCGGRNPLTGLDVADLIENGVRRIVDLREEHEWTGPGRYGAEAVAAVDWCGLQRIHLPIRDGSAPASEDLDHTWKILHQDPVDTSGAVYVHCRAGQERTGAILVAHLARQKGLRYRESLGRLQKADCPIHLLPNQEWAVRQWLKVHPGPES